MIGEAALLRCGRGGATIVGVTPRGRMVGVAALFAAATGACGGGSADGAGGVSGSSGAGASAGLGGTSGAGGTGAIAGGGSAGVSGTSGTGGTAASGGTSGSGGSGGTGASGGSAGASGCPTGLPGPALVQVPAPAGGSYCMDATEVTNADYAAFLAVSPSTSGQLPECSWNTSYVPSSGWPAAGKDNYPVVYVDWCDAYAYCKWAGKRLCGKIGGGANGWADYANAALSQWYAACSAGGAKTYPYGSTYSGTTCVGSDYDGTSGYQSGSDVARPVGSAAGCEGGYPGLFDLSGNVWEWEDSCNGTTGAQDACRLRGGSFGVVPSSLACGCDSGDFRGFDAFGIGFRCCRG